AAFVSLPADHVIADPRRFRATVADAFTWANRERCPVTIGIVPTCPETGYGYIRLGAPIARGARWVAAFVEKPSLARARKFVASREYLWNSGMFVWRVDTLLALLGEHLPDVLATLTPVLRCAPGRRRGALARAYR